MNVIEADHSWNEALCEMARSTPMPGTLQLIYARDPDYFAGSAVQGQKSDVILATKHEKPVFTYTISAKRMYVNGREQDFGYISGLKIMPEFRNQMYLARAFHDFARRAGAYGVPGFLMTIIEDNHQAIRSLTTEHKVLPCIHDMGRYTAYSFPVRRKSKTIKPGHCRITDATEHDFADILAFWRRSAPERQFSPAYTDDDFSGAMTNGFDIRNLLVAVNGGRITGTLGLWDQSGFKQNVIERYSPFMRFCKPFYDARLTLAGYHGLPPEGSQFRMVYAAFICIENNDAEIFHDLLDAALGSPFASEFHLLVTGLHERDPLNAVAQRFWSYRYSSRLFLMTHDETLIPEESFESHRIPFLEVASL